MPDIESKIERIPETGCWIWMKTVTHDGYARLGGSDRDRNKQVHRLMYEQVIGPIPEGLQVDHRCNVRCCVNPYHLDAVTPKENQRRARLRRGGAKIGSPVKICKHGHAFDAENTHVRADGRRECKACKKAWNRAHSGKFPAGPVNVLALPQYAMLPNLRG